VTDGASATSTAPGPEARPAPSFEILGAEAVRHAAAPTLHFAAQATEPEGREVYTIALRAQIMIEPAKRSYDEETKARLVELFGEPERWGTTTRPSVLAEIDVLVPAFTGATTFTIPFRSSFDLELAAAKYIYSLPDGNVPLTFNFTGTIFYRAGDGRMQIEQIRWDCSAGFALPVSTWRDMIRDHYPKGGWVALETETFDLLAARKAELGLPSFDATIAALLEEEG